MSADGQLLVTLFFSICGCQMCVNKRYAKYPWEIHHSVVLCWGYIYKMLITQDGV